MPQAIRRYLDLALFYLQAKYPEAKFHFIDDNCLLRSVVSVCIGDKLKKVALYHNDILNTVESNKPSSIEIAVHRLSDQDQENREKAAIAAFINDWDAMKSAISELRHTSWASYPTSATTQFPCGGNGHKLSI